MAISFCVCLYACAIVALESHNSLNRLFCLIIIDNSVGIANNFLFALCEEFYIVETCTLWNNRIDTEQQCPLKIAGNWGFQGRGKITESP